MYFRWKLQNNNMAEWHKMDIFTVRKRSCRKVMFSEACVKISVWMGWHPPDRLGRHAPAGRHPPGQTLPWADTPLGQTPHWADTPLGRHTPGQTPPAADGYCSRCYASYWNAFLFKIIFLPVSVALFLATLKVKISTSTLGSPQVLK